MQIKADHDDQCQWFSRSFLILILIILKSVFENRNKASTLSTNFSVRITEINCEVSRVLIKCFDDLSPYSD